jgi:hypothetical protein
MACEERTDLTSAILPAMLKYLPWRGARRAAALSSMYWKCDLLRRFTARGRPRYFIGKVIIHYAPTKPEAEAEKPKV